MDCFVLRTFNGFLSYLWGIEIAIIVTGHRLPCAFYPTYEELKYGNDKYEAQLLKLFILPMRNWNLLTVELIGKQLIFLSYLWGIEIAPFCYASSSRRFLFILPMRNWNLYQKRESKSNYETFYPTYEELKLEF